MLRQGRGVDVEQVVRAAMRRNGVITWSQLRQEVPRRAVQAAVREGALERIGRGSYALPRAPDALRAALTARGVASHASAAQLWFMETLRDPPVAHVTVPRRARAHPAGRVRLHWNDLDDDEVRGRVTSPLRTVLDCARTLPFPEALAVADSALHRELVTPEALRAQVRLSRASGIRAARRVVALADGRAANPFESALRATVLDAGFTGFVPQLPVTTPRLAARVDLGDPELGLVLEADSFAWHGSRVALDRDCRRYDELVRSGWTVLRFSWEQVMFEVPWVVEVVSDTIALGRRGHRCRQVCRIGDRAA